MFHCDKRSSDIVFGETTSRVAARWRFVIGRGAMRGVRFFRTPTPRGKGFFFFFFPPSHIGYFTLGVVWTPTPQPRLGKGLL